MINILLTFYGVILVELVLDFIVDLNYLFQRQLALTINNIR